jgi:hypothetical protein
MLEVVAKKLVEYIGLIRDVSRCEVNQMVLAEISTELNWHNPNQTIDTEW